MSDCALSLKIPVGSPLASRTIVPPVDVRRLSRDARGAKRRGVRQRHVAIQASDPHGMPRRFAVDPLPTGQFPTPELVVPIAVANPRSFRHATSELADAARELGRRGSVSKLHGRQAQTAGQKMYMRVYESRERQTIRARRRRELASSLVSSLRRSSQRCRVVRSLLATPRPMADACCLSKREH